jgi:signal transduction histidine kinase
MSSDVVWIRDIAAEGAPIHTGVTGVHTAVAVPIASGGRTLAVLTFFADVIEDRSDDVVGMLKGIAGHVGQFLERRRAEDLVLALARSKDEYVGLIGHEMRTPLTSIAAYTGLLRELDPAEFAATGRRLLDAVERNSSQLRHIVDELLDLAALDTGHASLNLCACDLGKAVAEVLEGHPELSADGFTVAVDCPRECVVTADPQRLRQVVGVLVGNAIAYSPDGGDITISVCRTGRRMAELTVTDTGIGIPESERDQLFGRFYRSSRARDRRIPGSGLALATCRAILDRHQGSIAVIPTEGTGTAIRIRLPLYRPGC